jgi:hypothetical protein
MFIAMTGGPTCTSAIQRATALGMNATTPLRMVASVCEPSNLVSKASVGGSGADGWMIANGGIKDLDSSRYDGDPFVVHARAELAAAGLPHTTSGSLGVGYFFGWAQLQALQIAAQLDGGLTRTNLMLAVRAMDMTHPMLVEGVKFNLFGSWDAYPVEGAIVQTRNATTETWEDLGSVIDLSGLSTNCHWNPVTRLCS